MIDVDIGLSVANSQRRFDLTAQFATDSAFAGLYGDSGAGKTLTLQAIAGLLTPSKGHIKLNGRTLFDSTKNINLKPAERRVGYLFQSYALFPHLTVRENIAFGLTSWHKRTPSLTDQERVDALLHRFGLMPLASSHPTTLSGGQQQRAALARALACEPQALLLDEPFAALHPALRLDLRRELAEVQREWGIPVLMISHDVQDMMTLAGTVFVYADGRVLRGVRPSELL